MNLGNFTPRTDVLDTDVLVGERGTQHVGLLRPESRWTFRTLGTFFTKRVATIAELKAISVTGLANGTIIIVNDYSASGDQGGGRFKYDSGSSATDNLGTIIAPNSGTGRWLRVYSGKLNVRWFGAKGDGSPSDTAAIAAAIAALPSLGGEVFFPSGTYLTNVITLPDYPKNVRLIGDGRDNTILQALGANQVLIKGGGFVVNYGGSRCEVRQMSFKAHASGSTGICVDCRNISWSLFEDLAFVSNGTGQWDIGFRCDDDTAGPYHCYYNTWNRVVVQNFNRSPRIIWKFSFSSGNHLIKNCRVTQTYIGGAPTMENAFNVGNYCRHICIQNCHFEGNKNAAGKYVIQGSSFGLFITECYFEDTGPAFGFDPNVVTDYPPGTYEYTVVEKCSFAVNSLEAGSLGLDKNVVWRDNNAFGDDPTIVALIRTLEHVYPEVKVKSNSGYQSLTNSNSQNAAWAQNLDKDGKYFAAGGAVKITLSNGALVVQTAPVGVAGAVATFTTRLTLTAAGVLTIGAYGAGTLHTNTGGIIEALAYFLSDTGGYTRIYNINNVNAAWDDNIGTDGKHVATGQASRLQQTAGMFNFQNSGSQVAGTTASLFQSLIVQIADAAGYNAAATALMVAKNAGTGRSINAAGTLNASGADYAEYMRKAPGCGDIAKGAIVGVNAKGLLTDKFDQAVSFLVKSTNPAYVGGDVWGTEELVGKRPVEPVAPKVPKGNASKTAAADFEKDQASHEANLAHYREKLPVFEAKLEAERQKVDRVAFSGQVPVNVMGASPGDHIVPVDNGSNGIAGSAVKNPTFEQYRNAVGRVIAIGADGRATIIVKVS